MKTLLQFKKDMQSYYKYIIYSGKSSLKAEIANSHLSWMWWILDPLLFMLVYSFISIIVFKTKEQYFAAFVFIGLSTWTFFEKTVKGSVKLVKSNKQIVSKVYIPKYILIFVKMYINGFKMMISFSLVLIVMLLYRVPISFKVLFAIPIMIDLMLLTFGISAIMLHFGVFVEDLANVINILLKLAFYLSGIFYSITKRVPEPYCGILLKLNPIALVIDDLRASLIYNTMPHLILLAAWFVVGLVLSIIGIRTIYKYENSYVKVM